MDTTKVVYLQAIRDWPLGKFITETMHICHTIIDKDSAVKASVMGAQPQPASVRAGLLTNLGPQSFLW